MKNQPFNRSLQAIIFLCVVITAIGVSVNYSETVSSEKIENNKNTGIPKASAHLNITQGIGSPVVSKAVAFGESLPIRDISKMGDNSTGMNNNSKKAEEIWRLKQTRKDGVSIEFPDVDGGETKTTSNLVRTIDPTVPHSVDGAMSTYNSSTTILPQTLPTPTVSFEGISVFDTVPLGQGFLPPDTSGDVGPNHYVQAVNVAFRVWDKSGTPLTPAISLGTLFSPLPPPCASSISGAPNVIYDQLADRWLVSQRCGALPSHYLVAVSKTGDPTGAYYLYDFMMPNLKHLTNPKLGVWPDGYYMAEEQFDKRLIFFRGAGFLAFDRAKMLAGDPTASYVYFDSCPDLINCRVAGAVPSDVDGFIPPPPGSPNVFAVFTSDEYGDPQGDALRLFDFHVDFSNPENSTFTERAGSPLPVAPFDPLAFYIRQPGTGSSSNLDPVTGALMFRLAYRNFGSGTESLILTHAVDTPSQDHVGVRYYQLNRTAPGALFSIAEQQTFSPDSTSRWVASGAMNFQGDTAVGFSASSDTVHPSIRYAAKFSTDPAGSGLAQGEQTIIAGSGSQFSTTRRWGGYSQMSVDPTDDCTFWYTQEYYAANNTNGWQTRIAKFAPRQCSVSPRGTIQGTVTSCTTGLPLSGVSVDATGGFNRLTGTSGTYSMTVLPGTYSVLPKKLGYTASQINGVEVIDGGTSTQGFCMTPMAELSSSASVPTVTTGNGLIEPNECNSLNIPITNNGAATATAVSATLSTTAPGVTITNATSTYADIAANGGVQTNTTPFQISTDNTVACLSRINLTLTVTYAGGSSPSVLNIPITVGQPKGPNYVFTTSTGTIPTTGTLVPGSRENLLVNIPAPFAFTLYGRQVATGKIMKVHQFGVIEVDTNDPNPLSINYPLPTTTFESPIAVLVPHWSSIWMQEEFVTGGGIFTETTGTAPNRTFMIEWRGRIPSNFNYGLDLNFALFFHENSDDFEYVYARTGWEINANGRFATVGVQGLSYGSNFTQYSYNTPIIVPGLKLTASRPTSICSQGTGTCGLTVGRTPFDYDGDGKADVSVFRPANGGWYVLNSRNGSVFSTAFGQQGDLVAPADFDGDGKTDVSVFRNGNWYRLNSSNNQFVADSFGAAGDLPVPGDFDGDGRADISVFRPSNGIWYRINSTNNQFVAVAFGQHGDKPQVGDFDGDGKTDVAVWRPSNGTWYVLRSSDSSFYGINFGASDDIPAVGDFDGDGKSDVSVFRASNGNWYRLNSSNNEFVSAAFGATGDIPVTADYDGDGRADLAVFRPSNGTWYLQRSTQGFTGIQFGQNGDIPTPSVFGQ